MRALAVEEAGSIDNLKIVEVPKPEPLPGQVRVKVHAAGLNPVDYKLIENPLPEWEYPHISGLDAAGVIDEIGTGVTGWKPGDKVFFHGSLAHQGGFAEYTLAAEKVLAPLPEGWSFTEAAALPTPALTAYQALHRKLSMKRGQTIMIQAGAGAVGGFSIQLASLAGLNIITTCSPGNNEHVMQLGAHKVIDYNTENVVEEVHRYTNGRGVDIAMDMIGKQTTTDAFDYLAFNGHLLCAVDLPDISHYAPKTLAPSIHEIALGFVYRSDDKEQIADLGNMAKEVGQLAAANKIIPMVEEEISLENIPESLHRIKKGHVRGNIVAKI